MNQLKRELKAEVIARQEQVIVLVHQRLHLLNLNPDAFRLNPSPLPSQGHAPEVAGHYNIISKLRLYTRVSNACFYMLIGTRTRTRTET